MRLEDWPLPYLRVSCAKCEREGRLKLSGIIERFGPDCELYVVREKLTAPSCKRPDLKQPCQSFLPDALLVQAIMAERKEDIIKPQLIEEAANWNPKWLEDPK